MTKRIILSLLFLLGLIYILWPGPSSINDFPPLPNSLKSNEPGDTRQMPNVVAYFSNFNRKNATEFYKKEYADKFFWGKIIPPVSLNYPPRDAYTYIRDMQISTFLEEYVYPLKGSIFVNGYEQYVVNELIGRSHDPLGDRLQIDGQFFASKTTLRFYPVNPAIALIVYMGIWAASYGLVILSKKALGS